MLSEKPPFMPHMWPFCCTSAVYHSKSWIQVKIEIYCPFIIRIYCWTLGSEYWKISKIFFLQRINMNFLTLNFKRNNCTLIYFILFSQEHQKREKAMSSCQHCLEGSRLQKHLIVSLGTRCHLSLPQTQSLVEGHCLLVPREHAGTCTVVDEDTWEEMKVSCHDNHSEKVTW